MTVLEVNEVYITNATVSDWIPPLRLNTSDVQKSVPALTVFRKCRASLVDRMITGSIQGHLHSVVAHAIYAVSSVGTVGVERVAENLRHGRSAGSVSAWSISIVV